MGKAEVRDQLYDFLERGTEYAFEELRPLAVVGLGFLPGNGAAKLLLRPVIDDDVKEIEVGLKNELTLVMDYAEEMVHGGGTSPSKYRRKFLKSDIFFRHYKGERRDELEEALVRHFEEMAHDMIPLLKAEADDFWGATRGAYDKYEAEEIFKHHFSFVERVTEEFGDGLEMKSSIGPFGFDYTNEALRILPKVETRIRREVVDEVDDAYGSRYEDVGSGDVSAVASEEPRKDRKREREEPDGRAATDEEMEKLRESVKKLKKENEELHEELKKEREKKEELNEKLEEERERNEELHEELEEEGGEKSYKAEDWLG